MKFWGKTLIIGSKHRESEFRMVNRLKKCLLVGFLLHFLHGDFNAPLVNVRQALQLFSSPPKSRGTPPRPQLLGASTV